MTRGVALLSCMDDACGTCLYAWCCSPCAFADARSVLYDGDEPSWVGSCCMFCLCYIACGFWHGSQRTKWQEVAKNQQHWEEVGSCMSNYLAECCCEPCARAQHYITSRRVKGGAPETEEMSR